jgi:hypothetical protein
MGVTLVSKILEHIKDYEGIYLPTKDHVYNRCDNVHELIEKLKKLDPMQHIRYMVFADENGRYLHIGIYDDVSPFIRDE